MAGLVDYSQGYEYGAGGAPSLSYFNPNTGSAPSVSSGEAGLLPAAGSIFGPLGTVAGGIIGAVASHYATNAQARENRRAREAQERLFNQQMGWEKEQYAGNMALKREELGAKKQQFETNVGLTKAQMRAQQRAQNAQYALSRSQLKLSKEAQGANIALSNRQMDLEEKKTNADLQNNRFNQIGAMIANMTRFYSSPGSRAQLASMYGRRR